MKSPIVLLVVAATLSLGACSAADNSGTGADSPNDNIYSLVVGDCFNDDTSAASASDTTLATTVDIVDCGTKHQFEVYAREALDGDIYPGDDAVSLQADDACYLDFEDFAGAPFDAAIGFTYTALQPTTESWATGDREILCSIATVDGETVIPATGTLKGAASDLAPDDSTSGDDGSGTDSDSDTGSDEG